MLYHQRKAHERLLSTLPVRTHERRLPPERKGYRYTGKLASEAGRQGRNKTGYGKRA